MIKSTIGTKPVHKKNIEALGLKKIGQVVVKADNPQMRGMIAKVQHLVEVEEV
jgi:large subunit ribosomal protein L30